MTTAMQAKPFNIKTFIKNVMSTQDHEAKVSLFIDFLKAFKLVPTEGELGVNDITKFGFDVMDCCNMPGLNYTTAIIGGKLVSASNAPDLGIVINVSEHLLTVATPSMSIRSQVWPKTYNAYVHATGGATYYSRKIQNLKQFQTLLSRYCDWRSMLAIKEINSLQDQPSAAVNKQELFGAAADILRM